MRFGHPLGTTLYIVCCTALLLGQSKQPPTKSKAQPQTAKSDEKRTKQKDSGNSHGPIEILSDTGGVDVHPYIDRVLPLIKANWYKRIPDWTVKEGKVTINFRLMKDGHITDVVYVDRTDDSALDQAAFDSITGSSPLPSLPIDYTCQDIHLQIHFYYNLDVPPPEHPKGSLIPCVRSRIGYVQPVAISVSPVSAEVIAGARQQFSVRVTGDENAEVKWTVSGPGCSESACGSISPQGLYVAPSSIPSPPKVIVTATLASDATETATATVTVVKSPASR